MSKELPIAQQQVSLIPEYSTPYNALIRDNIVMGVSRYFIERWVPFLGTGPATVVNTLRQLSYHCEGDAITISGEALAHEAAMSRRHLYTCLESKWLRAFIRLDSGRRVRTDAGKILQQSNRYYVRMDDPLNPADADHLLQVLKNLADTPLEAARRALELEPRDLWANSPTCLSQHFTRPRAITAQEVLMRAFPAQIPLEPEQKQALNQAAEALHRHITLVRSDGRANKIIVPHYFRWRWWKRLGPDLAWIYLLLRGYVYDNPEEGIRRDTCWIPSLNTILNIIGRPREWWRRKVEHAEPQPEGWLLTDFFIQIADQKGRDPAHPQWVARQFKVALDIPVAPEDRVRYTELLQSWPSLAPTGSATVRHTGTEGVCHSSTHRGGGGLPQFDTPGRRGSATVRHTGAEGVCHVRAQGSATPAHSKAKDPKQEPADRDEQDSTTKQQGNATDRHTAVDFKAAVGANIPLVDQLANAIEQSPMTPLCEAIPVRTWLQQVWPEPVRPHTPAWTLALSGQVTPRDLVALILAIWADKSIKHPPRYLSWLVQRWQTLPDTPPVDKWEQWHALADLPIGEWLEKGRMLWIELAPRDNRALPFGLDALAAEAAVQRDENRPDSDANVIPILRATAPETPVVAEIASTGLDERPGGGPLTIRDIWLATLSQLSAQMGRSAYTTWLEGTKAVSYVDGVLTVCARHSRARDLMAERLHQSIEWTASMLAQVPIKMCYTSDTSLPT